MKKICKLLGLVIATPIIINISILTANLFQKAQFHTTVNADQEKVAIPVDGKMEEVATLLFYGILQQGLTFNSNNKKVDLIQAILSPNAGKAISSKDKAIINQILNDLIKTNSKPGDYEMKETPTFSEGFQKIEHINGDSINWNSDPSAYDKTNFLYWVDDFMNTKAISTSAKFKDADISFNINRKNQSDNIYGAGMLDLMGDGFLALSKTFTNLATSIAYNIHQSSEGISEIEQNKMFNREFHVFANFQNIASLYNYAYSNTALELEKKKQILPFDVLYVQDWNNFFDVMNSAIPVWYPGNSIAKLIVTINNYGQDPNYTYNVSDMQLVNAEINFNFLPFSDYLNHISLKNNFICDWFPSAQTASELFQKAEITSEINKFNDPKVNYDSTDVSNYLAIINNKILPNISVINEKAINYLTKLFDLTTNNLQILLQPFIDKVNSFKNEYLTKDFNFTEKEKPFPKAIDLANEFYFFNTYGQLIYSQSVNYLFDNHLSIPADPWGTKTNPIFGSNIVLFVLIFLLAIFIAGYLIINFAYLEQVRRTPSYLENSKAIQSKSKSKKVLKNKK